MPLLISLFVFLTIGLAAWAFLYGRAEEEGDVSERLRHLRPASRTEGTVVQKTLGPLERLLARFGEPITIPARSRTRLQNLLLQGGYRKRGSLQMLMGIKLVSCIGFGLATYFVYLFFITPGKINPVLLVVFGAAAGFVLPNFIMARKVKARQIEIFHDLPDMLDLLTICVEAGLGLDAAVLQVAREPNFARKELGKEFLTLNQQIRAGMARRDALRDLVERTGVDAVKSFAAMLIQTEKLGTSLAQTLRVHSDSLRTKRRQLAEEMAAKISVKLVFPLAIFVLPSLFVVLLGPALIQISKSLFR